MDSILFYIFIILIGGLCLYLFVRLSSYAILQSIEDIKRKRKEKKNASTKGR